MILLLFIYQSSKHNFQEIDKYQFVNQLIITHIHKKHIKSIDADKYLKITCITGT